MELLKKDKNWFLSEEGSRTFAALNSVGDHAVFIYSYLKILANENLDKDNFLFKTSFLLADAVHNSAVEYHGYPDLLDESKNPFVAFVANANQKYTDEQIYCIFLSFVHGIANPFSKSDWIYDSEVLKGDGYIHKVDDSGHMFVIPNEDLFVDADVYACDEKYNLIQLEIIWLFGNTKR